MQPPESQALAAGLAALNLSLDDGQQSALLAYLALIGKWNRVYNLTAVRDPAEMLTLHLLDSLSVVAPLHRHVGDRPARVLDVGSGACPSCRSRVSTRSARRPASSNRWRVSCACATSRHNMRGSNR